jgi:chorismate dehydratase
MNLQELSMSIRIGAVSYLNTKPLIYGLQHRLTDSQLLLDLPSRLSDQLSEGQLDVALIPSVEYFRGPPEWSIISDACIACRGAVRSVQLLFRKQPSQVKTLALDEGSRTSAALAQVLLYEQFKIRPQLEQLPIAANFSDCPSDAILIIGDRAMQIDRNEYVETWDLGEKWFSTTGLPFVFAMWVARCSQPVGWNWDDVTTGLESSRNAGLRDVQKLAAQHSSNYGITTEDCLIYFTEQLHFQLGKAERSGLELFRQRAERLGLLSSMQGQTSSLITSQ